MKFPCNIVCVLFISCAGCHSALMESPSHDLSGRLAAIEAERLSPNQATRLAGPADSFNGRPQGNVPALALANRPSSITGPHAADSPGVAPVLIRPLTMGETGEELPADTSESHVDLADSASPANDRASSRPLNSFWDTVKRDVREAPHDLWRDTKLVYANPVNLVILGTTYGGALTLKETGVDSTVEHHFNRNHDFKTPNYTFSDDWRDAFGAVGNPGTHFALAGLWYLVGQQTMDDKTYEVSKTLFSALAINGVTVLVGQAASFDKSPNGEYGTMPSGHTSSSFVFASVMHRAYGHLIGVPLYGLASLVAYERVEDGEHYFSDVVMGGVLGLVVGHSVAGGRDPEIFGWKLVPWASPQGGVGIAFTKPLE